MAQRKPLFVAVAGGSGSGKSSIVRILKESFASHKPVLFFQDDYYRDLSHLDDNARAEVNFDHPRSLDVELMRQHLVALHGGQAIERPQYDFVTHTRKVTTQPTAPSDLLFFDGIFSLYYPELLALFEIRIFVDVDADVRFIRRLARDMKERGRTIEGVVDQYLDTVRPMHRAFVEDTRRNATHVLNWEQWDVNALAQIKGAISRALEASGGV